MATEAQLLAQITALDGFGSLKSASLPNDDIADYQLIQIALLKAIEEKAAGGTISYLAAALGRRGSATSLSTVDAQLRAVSATLVRVATTPTYASGQAVGAAAGSLITLTNLFGSVVGSTSVKIRKIGLLRTVAAGTLAAANYRIVTANDVFQNVADAVVLSPTIVQAGMIGSISTINMTSISPNVQYGEIELEIPILSPTAGGSANGSAVILNLGSVVALASESFALTYYLED